VEDPAGYAGFGASVDEHLNKVFTSSLLLSIIGAGAQLSWPQEMGSIYAAPSIDHSNSPTHSRKTVVTQQPRRP
jgi:type IV secretory pathway VirB10-like protein